MGGLGIKLSVLYCTQGFSESVLLLLNLADKRQKVSKISSLDIQFKLMELGMKFGMRIPLSLPSHRS